MDFGLFMVKMMGFVIEGRKPLPAMSRVTGSTEQLID